MIHFLRRLNLALSLLATIVGATALAEPGESPQWVPDDEPGAPSWARPKLPEPTGIFAEGRVGVLAAEVAKAADTPDAGVQPPEVIIRAPVTDAGAKPKWRRQSPNLHGNPGLLHVGSADLGPKGQLRLSVIGEHFRARNFPTPSAFHTHTGGSFGASFTALDWLELSLVYRDGANTNTALEPRLIQRVGDMSLGARLSWKWLERLQAGFSLSAETWAPSGSLDARHLAFGLSPSLFGSFDLQNEYTRIPLFLHLNVGARFDSTPQLAQGETLSLAEQYAYGVNQYPRVGVSAGLEAPLRYATAFFEYRLEWPFGARGRRLVGEDGRTIFVADAAPQSIALGTKIPAFHRFNFLVAGDIGLSKAQAHGVRPTPPVTLLFGASVDLMATGLLEEDEDKPVVLPPPRIAGVVREAKSKLPLEGAIIAVVGTGLPPVASEAPSGRFLTHDVPEGPLQLVVEKAGYRKVVQRVQTAKGHTLEVELELTPLRGKIDGLVIDARSGEPVRSAIVSVSGSSSPPVATNGQGRFRTFEVPSGEVSLQIEREGYVPASAKITVVPGETAEARVSLVPEEKAAWFLVQVEGPKKKPVKARVEIRGKALYDVTTSEGSGDPVKQEVKPDLYVVEVTAGGFLAQTREVQVSQGAEMPLAFTLTPTPKKKLVVVKKDKIEILQQVHFETNRATIRPISYPLLHEVVDAIVQGDLKRVRVEGHTDSRGDDATNLRLSQARAEAVMEFLVGAGISRSRLEAAGFGETRPIAPNLTLKGRELNRRVEFIILPH